MASIKIFELRPTGYELFQDSESFLNELNEQNYGGIIGGKDKVVSLAGETVASQASVSGGQVSITIGFTICEKCKFKFKVK